MNKTALLIELSLIASNVNAESGWWHPIDELSVGLQYRYAHNKLGQPKTDSALIYTLKYDF